MSTVTLENVLSVNDELAAFAEAGIPSSIALGCSPEKTSAALGQINSSLTLRSNLGQSLIAAATENQDLPADYRSALEVGLRSNRLTATLDGVSRQAVAEVELRSTIGRSLISPLIIVVLTYLGFIILCVNYSPAIEGMYTQVGQTPGRAAAYLITLREWLPYWAVLVPLALLGCIYLWRRGWGGWQRWIPGTKRYLVAVRNSNFAHQLRLLIENEIPLADSLPLAAAVTGDEAIIAASTALATAHERGESLSVDSRELITLPPILRWALTNDLGDQSLPELLLFVEKTYRQAAERRAAAWRVALPATIGAFLGGFAVLIYGLSLFGPFTQLIQDVTN